MSDLSPKDILNKLNAANQDFQQAPEAEPFEGFEVLDEGDYLLTVQNYDWKESENGNLGLSLELICEQHKKAKIWHTFWLTPKNMPYVKRDFKILGINIQNLENMSKMNWMRMPPFWAHVAPEEYDGKEYNRIKWIIGAKAPKTQTEKPKVEETNIGDTNPFPGDELPF